MLVLFNVIVSLAFYTGSGNHSRFNEGLLSWTKQHPSALNTGVEICISGLFPGTWYLWQSLSLLFCSSAFKSSSLKNLLGHHGCYECTGLPTSFTFSARHWEFQTFSWPNPWLTSIVHAELFSSNETIAAALKFIVYISCIMSPLWLLIPHSILCNTCLMNWIQ